MNDYKNINFFPSVNLIISNVCRMKCKFCCGSDVFNLKKIDKNNLFKIIDILHENGTKRICFSGGEPLLCPYLDELIKKSYEYNIINTVMSSDGKMISKMTVNNNYLDTVWLSVHGLDADHDNITNRKGSFKDLENAIINKGKTYPLGIWSVVTVQSKDQIENLIKWCINHDIKKLYLSNLNETGDGKEFCHSNGRISDVEFKKIVDYYSDKYKDNINISGQKFNRDCQCTLIYPNGDIYLTPFKKEESNQILIGNLLKDDPKIVFSKIKNNPAIWQDYISRYKNSSLLKK